MEVAFNDTESEAINKFLFYKGIAERTRSYTDKTNKLNLERKLKTHGESAVSK
jgi:hypothetical protein